MPSLKESSGQQSQIESSLDTGLEQIASKQTVTFRQYRKFVLSQDGYVFWVTTGAQMEAIGSLHYATDRQQSEDETIGQNHMVFNAENEITQFNLSSPDAMWIGGWIVATDPSVPALRVAFSQRGNYFRDANVWHYSGFAIYPAMQTQIIDDETQIPQGPIVSNSLPIWLSQTTVGDTSVPVYPSFLVPDNLVPPYIVAHIPPERTETLGSFPVIGPWPGTTLPNTGASPLHKLGWAQLMRDEVILTLYGFDNVMALEYLGELIDASETGAAPFGFANSPAIRDEKRQQTELAALAQKKSITILANYYQGGADIIARRLLLSASVASVSTAPGPGISGSLATLQDEQHATATGTVYE